MMRSVEPLQMTRHFVHLRPKTASWIVARLLLIFPLFGVMGNSSCVVHTCDDDDFDDDDDCDDGDDDDFNGQSSGTGVTQNGSPAGGGPTFDVNVLRIENYREILATDPRAYPIRKLIDIEGISLFKSAGESAYGAEELRAFAERLLRDNQDLIGLPARSGELLFQEVQFLDSGIRVRYAQLTTSRFGIRRLVPGARMLFVFDLLGNLVEIENATQVTPA